MANKCKRKNSISKRYKSLFICNGAQFRSPKQARIFDEVYAVIFGNFINFGNDNLVEVVKERSAKSANFPVFKVQEIGHEYINDPLPLNTHATISVQDEKEGLFFMDVQNIGFMD
ncbi:hypothetical protein [Wolbachia endosymbiont of Wuchereria bancrofti]|uniref:hypothetical protein n=1 Tax=Wolbachia endosymbiont of Wuchereria bancrofti TaxID=96496 RepID=UPI0039794AC2